MIGLIIYLTGFVMAYYRTKKSYINDFGEDDWTRVIFGIGFGLASWFGYFIAYALDTKKPKSKSTPPKWL